MGVRIQLPDRFDQIHRQPRSSVHRHIKSDQSRITQRRFVQWLTREV
jgi:hypothetical protein